MKTSFKALLAVSAVALLAACGGGSADTTTPPANQPAWASPALFVPAGQAQVSIAVSGCTADSGRSVVASFEALQRSNSVAVNSPTLVITSAGDVIFSGAVAPATSITELVRINFADATVERSINFSSTPANNGFSIESATGNIGFTEGTGVNNLRARNNAQDIRCNTIANLTPAYAPSEARLADKFTAGATGWRNTTNSNATATFVNNQVVWDNQDNGTSLDANQTSARYAGLNVATGALSVGSNSGQVTQSVALSAAAASGGLYTETFDQRGVFSPGATKRANLTISTSSQGILEFQLEAASNVIFVTPKLGQSNVL